MNDLSVLKSMPVVDERSSSGATLIETVTRIFSDITRYPVEIIDPQADLENDLGIDSVKFGEIFSTLRDRFALPGPEVMKTLPRERFRSVAGIADIIAEFGGAGAAVSEPVVTMPAVAALETAPA
ncbi:MAG: acyl carrier protein, partial [Rhodospirillaceae bacterium]